MSSESVEEYLEAIYKLNERGRMAKNVDLAKSLKITPPSVTQMIQKLSEEGLVVYEPYKGVMLTGKGMALAQKVVRKHRLLERFLHDYLNLDRDVVHDEACRMEHTLSDLAAAALCKAMDKPKTCPDDDNPIPPCPLEIDDCDECAAINYDKEERFKLLTQLSNLQPEERATVAFVRDGKRACQRIMDMGLCPGTEVEVLQSAPFMGPIQVKVRGITLALGRKLAAKVIVEVDEPERITHPHGPHHYRKRGHRKR